MALSPLAPHFWEVSNVPIDPLALHLPIHALFTDASGFLPHGHRGLEHLMPFPFFCLIVFGGKLCVGSLGKWISSQMVPSRALKRAHPRETRAQGCLSIHSPQD